MTGPNPATTFPLEGIKTLCFLKNILHLKNVIVGDYTYYDDFESVENFARNIRYRFEFTGDRLVIGKFCQIASGVEFIMNGGNHLSTGLSTFPFSIFGGGWQHAMEGKSFPNKGDTIIGNDVWLGYRSLIMPGVHIGDGAIIATASVVTKNVPAYAVVGGNPARVLRMRFDPDDIERLLRIRWWDWDAGKITRHLHLLTSSDPRALESAV